MLLIAKVSCKNLLTKIILLNFQESVYFNGYNE